VPTAGKFSNFKSSRSIEYRAAHSQWREPIAIENRKESTMTRHTALALMTMTLLSLQAHGAVAEEQQHLSFKVIAENSKYTQLSLGVQF
jgi:hypothetical protein